MARKSEIGIEYFPMNSDIIHNSKVKLVVAEFGIKAWAVLLPLYCKIYREKGYWIDWFDEDSKMLFAQDECKIELTFVNEIVNGLIRRSLFNKGVFDSFGVLTSDRIQENYLTAKKRNSSVGLIDEFAVKNEKGEYVYKFFDNVDIIKLDVHTIKKKVNILPQKERKNEILEGEGDSGSPPKHTHDEIVLFKNFETFISAKAPNVGKMKEPFKIQEYLNLKKKFSSDQIKEMVLKMHNYKPLLKNNNSSYLTFLNWSAKDYDSKPEPGISNINEKLKSSFS